MKWSWKIATIYGISIRLHWTMIVFLAWIGVANLADKGLSAALTSVGVIGLVFMFIVLHELGHALTARHYGIRTRDITLLPIGGLARLQKMPEEPSQELAIALAGPAVNLVFVIVLGATIWLLHGWRALFTMPSADAPLLNFSLMVNAIMGLFNMLPAFPMDGGRVLRAILATRMGYTQATDIAASVGQVFAILLGILGVFTNGMLVFIALFVYLGAQQAAIVAQTHSVLNGVAVHEAMRTHFAMLQRDAPFSAATDEFIAGNQHDFPVVDRDQRLCGMVYRNDLLKALHQESRPETIEQVMQQNCQAVSADATLEQVFQTMNEIDCSVLPVIQRDQVVGLISLENIGEWMMIHATGRGRSPAVSIVPQDKPAAEDPHDGSATLV